MIKLLYVTIIYYYTVTITISYTRTHEYTRTRIAQNLYLCFNLFCSSYEDDNTLCRKVGIKI